MQRERLRAITTLAILLGSSALYLIRYYGFPAPAAAQQSGSQTAQGALNAAFSLIRAKQPARAIPLLNAILTADPRNALALNDRCVANIMLGIFTPAIEDCQKAIALSPDLQLARNNLAWAEGERDKARQKAARQEQSSLSQRDETFYINEGLALLHAGNYEEAIRAWRRALQINPRAALAANNIGTALMLEHEPRQALAWFEKATKFEPSLQIARNNVAWAKSEIAKSNSAR